MAVRPGPRNPRRPHAGAGRGGDLQSFRRGRLAPMLLALLPTVACPSVQPPGPSAPPAPAGPRADLVLSGGTILTLDPALPEATALAAKDGRIVALGDQADVAGWIGPETQVMELDGRVVVPGLVDAHMHLAGLGIRRFGVDLVGTRSIEEVKARVAEAVRLAKPGEWIRGRGWDQNDWEAFRKRGLQFPTARDLDDVAPENPVVLRRIDGHAIWVNSKAIEVAGVTARTRAKPGGQIIKARGRPSGIFVDNAMPLIEDKVPSLTADQLRRALRLAQEECLAAGLTQVHDMGVDLETLRAMEEMDAAGDLRLRVYALHEGNVDDLTPAMERGPIIPEAESPSRLTVRGVKFYIDGALGSRGAALLQPYADDKKSSGLLLLDPAVFEARVRTVSERGFQVATHAIGDRANRLVLDTYARVFGARTGARPRVEHAQVVHPEDLPRFGELGVIASMQPTHATSDKDWAERRLGKARLEGAYAWRSLLASNATIAAGSDAPVEDISPILGLYAATTRKDLFGEPAEGWLPQERMSPEQALAAFTQSGAFASFREDQAGQIAVGRFADLTVLDQNPLTAGEELLASTQVMATVIAGRVEFTRADEGGELAPTETSTAAE